MSEGSAQILDLLSKILPVDQLVRATSRGRAQRIRLLLGPGDEILVVQEVTVRPQPDDPRLTRTVVGIDHEGRAVETAVVMERPLTLFLNGREIVTMMTIGDHPDYLAVGYLLNQNMLRTEDRIIS